MAQGGSIRHRLDEAVKRHEELNKEYMEKQLPPPRMAYRMNDDEFMHHVMVLVLERIALDKLGISEDEMKLYITNVWIEEQGKMLNVIKHAKSQQLREQLTQGIRIKPEI